MDAIRCPGNPESNSLKRGVKKSGHNLHDRGTGARRLFVLCLFFCSGATAHVYEVLWSKYLSLLFGSTVQAQTVVLAVFMGGLALGNKLFSARADRAQRPLGLYGSLEIAVGVYAALFPLLDWLADRVFSFAGSGMLDHSALLLAFKGLL